LLYWGYLLARIVARIVPIGVSYWIAERVADSWYALSPRTRDNLAYNLSLVPGAPADERPRALLARRIMRNFARMVTEFVYLPRIDRDTLGRWVHPESFQSLAEAMAGRRAILITCHLGNWELAAAVIAMMGVELHLVVYDHPDSRVARLFRERREAKGLKVMSVKQAAREITTTLKNRSVAIVGDRDYSGRGKEARFLGADVRVPYAYAGLAVALGVPVIAGFCVRQADGRYDLASRETVYDPPRDTKTPEEIVRTCLRIFEKGVEKYTEQWYFFERVDRRWGSPRK
jgi:KDO2-lipid IV(A) lauroyltransferase